MQVPYEKYMPTAKDIAEKHEQSKHVCVTRNFHRPLNVGDEKEMRKYMHSNSIGYKPFANLRLK
jgi:hypothetical protein